MNVEEQIENYRTLSEHFTRTLPDSPQYTDRLAEEIELITEQRFTPHFLRVLEVLELTKDIPHITRGSAGSSLVCWLLGITDVDPVQHRIPLARFINPLRDDLPDIDIDFPHNKHKIVLERIYKHWPGRAARLSNYVKYREKSARKEAVNEFFVEERHARNFAEQKARENPLKPYGIFAIDSVVETGNAPVVNKKFSDAGELMPV